MDTPGGYMTLSTEGQLHADTPFSEVAEALQTITVALEKLESRCNFLDSMAYPPETLKWRSMGFPCKFSDSDGFPRESNLKQFFVNFFNIGGEGTSLATAIQYYLNDLAKVHKLLDEHPGYFVTLILGSRLEFVWTSRAITLRTRLAYILEEGKE